MKIELFNDRNIKMTSLWILLVLYNISYGFGEELEASRRAAKSLAYYAESYLDSPPVLLDGAADEYTDYTEQFVDYPGELGSNDLASRARPGGSRPKPDSPVYYIRLPPTPYMLVPGVGYVSRPPTLRPPPVVQPRPPSQFINLPVKYVSNAKPTGIYTWKPDSPVTNLDKGPYVFNGRPTDIILLRNTYNALYDEGLQNFYP